LARRIDLFAGLVGNLQPILGATEEAFRKIFLAPRSERAAVQREVLAALDHQIDALSHSGIDLGDEDPMPDPDDPASPVTLEELHRCLAEQLDIDLDEPGRPATADPTRTSRDGERWCALATYGHPRLDGALLRLSGDSDASALVLSEVDGHAVAYRADRTPPERVRCLNDLLDLGAPVATGEAEARARLEAREAALAGEESVLAVERAHRVQWEREIRTRFRRLVVQAINAENIIRTRRDGEPTEPRLLWLDLTQDATTGWGNADRFRQWLELDIDDVLPRGAAGADDRLDRELARVRQETGKALVEVILEWKSVALPDGPKLA
jgi:hypothetical protein